MTVSSQVLVEKLREQNILYARLRELCERQDKSVAAEKVSELLDLMQRKDALVAQINELEKEIALLHDLWESEVERDETDLAVATEVERKKQLLLEVIELERESEAKVRRLQQRIGNVLQILSRGREMFDTLRDSSQDKSRFIDRKG